MNPVIESDFGSRRRSRDRLLFRVDTARNVLNERVIDGVESRRRFLFRGDWTLVAAVFSVHEFIKMHKSTRTGLIGLAILICLVAIILVANLVSISPKEEQPFCVKLDGEETCHAEDPNPYRLYGTKTPYRVAVQNNNKSDVPLLEGCTPIVFYMLSRHATRYPDEEYIVDLIKLLPVLKKNITESRKAGKVKMCEKDLDRIEKFELKMEKDDDNRISATGAVEAENLGRRLKRKFSSILDDRYSPEKFVIEYTTRERTKTTAENFAKGLFGEDYKKIDFKGKDNDGLLNFHKTCKKLRKKCEDPNYDVSEIDSFQNGPLMKKVVESVSERIGVELTSGDIKLIHIACVFGYALNNSDAWCSVFSKDDLKVLEFNDDIDDYYKDAYGNEVNYEQACPIAKYIFDLFKASENSNDTKVVLQFSHAGALKKVYAMFGLFRDELPLTADAFCSEQNRKWRSSFIAPFNTNILLVLYRCGDEYKVTTFHNERPVIVNGCRSELCSFSKFSATYEPISRVCNVSKICCTCCKE